MISIADFGLRIFSSDVVFSELRQVGLLLIVYAKSDRKKLNAFALQAVPLFESLANTRTSDGTGSFRKNPQSAIRDPK